MEYSDDILNLYAKVFSKQKKEFRVGTGDIMKSNRNITEAYRPNSKWEGDVTCKVADFNDASHRCAYLHKYAMLHTGLLCDVLEQARNIYAVKEALTSESPLRLCSLGSGPGTDIVSLIFFLQNRFGPLSCRATLVDKYVQWKYVFEAIVSELRNSTKFEHLREMVTHGNFAYEYVGADLLAFDDGDGKVCKSIRNAHVVTMVKFISAAACKGTKQMVKKIFHLMKPGALLLFVDNDAGGFHEALSRMARASGLKSVFGPLMHLEFEEPLFDRTYEQHLRGQYKTKVRVEVWRKTSVYVNQAVNTTEQLRQEYFRKTQGHDEVDRPLSKADGGVDTVGEDFHLAQESSASSEKEKGCCRIM